MAQGAEGPAHKDPTARLSVRTVSSMDEIDAAQWDQLARSTGAYNPFTSYAFLHALEKSKSVAPQAGWAPLHCLLEADDGALLGGAPLYAKGHSQGEYIFDHHWADAFERAGGRYYPKLLGAAPFTPVPGPRLLTSDMAHKRALGAAIMDITKQIGASSAHINFLQESDETALTALGYLARRDRQYHWFNRGYESFDDFLAALASRKRKAVKRERRGAVENGITIKRFCGDQISEREWDAFWLFYQDTGARKWGTPYLTRSFFRLIAETMADDLLLVIAERGGAPIAGALNFIGGDALYGRYWGCTEDHPFLHFEVCYHQAIEFAIERGLARVEAGAQGEHKLARGYEPVPIRSAHWIQDENFRTAIARYLDNERAHGEAEIDILSQYAPYKKGP